MAVLVNLDGRLVPGEEAHVSVFDHGFLYGDSVYETVRTYGGRCFLLQEHLRRLERSAAALGFLDVGSREEFAREVERSVAAAGNPESAVRIMLSRGEGPIGLDPSLCLRPRRIVIVRPYQGLEDRVYREGVRAIVARTLRSSPRALDPAIKSGNFLNNIQAAREASALGAFEALMLNADGCLAEGANSNVFVVLRGVLGTPRLGGGLLAGITRELVLALARDNKLAAEERDVFVAELYDAEEVFLTSTLKEVVPVVALGRHQVGDGKPGPVTRRLHALYRDHVEARSRPGASGGPGVGATSRP